MTKTDHTHETERGVKVSVWTDSDRAAAAAFRHYDDITELEMKCPYCGDEIWDNNSSYESDDDDFEDTYSCDNCDVLVTLVTPKRAGEYHNVLLAECRYEIEFGLGGEPSNWE